MHEFDAADEVRKLKMFISDAVRQAGFEDVVVAASGGVDSTVSAALAARSLGPNHVHIVMLPYGTLSSDGLARAKELAEWLSVPASNVLRRDIQPLLEPLFAHIPEKESLRRGNAMARMRMIVVYDHAKALNALVVGTENKSEHLLGYYTRFGDEASDIEPLKHIYKTHVYELAEYLGAPRSIIEAAPSAGLWGGQTDEAELGFSYEDADEIFYLTHDKQMSVEDVLALGIRRDVMEKVIAHAAKNDFKNHLPITIEDL